jgi:hypothetical protein
MSSFDLDHFRKLPTVREMMQYLKATCTKLGMGAARDAYDTGLGYCIKIGPDPAAKAQNKNEHRVFDSTGSRLVPEVLDHAPDFRWIAAETVRPIRSKEELDTAITTSSDWLVEDLADLHKKVRSAKVPTGSAWLDDLIDLARSADLKVDELHKGNWGMNSDGVLVVLDSGK